MKNVIRSAALFIGSMIGFSACLMKDIKMGENFEGYFMLICGIIAFISLFCLIGEFIINIFTPPKKKEKEDITK